MDITVVMLYTLLGSAGDIVTVRLKITCKIV